MGAGSAARVADRRWSARRFSLTSLMAALRPLFRDLDPSLLFHALGQETYLLPIGDKGGIGLDVGNIHDVHGLLRAEELVGLLLAVAGVLAHHQVARLDVGADAPQLEAVEALDERTGVVGDVLLHLVRGPVGAGAESHRDASGGHDDFLGHVEAERTHDLCGGTGLLLVEHLLDAPGVDVGDHVVEVVGARRAVLLHKERVLEHLPHRCQ